MSEISLFINNKQAMKETKSNLFVTKEIVLPNWAKVPSGTKFVARLRSRAKLTTGRIFKSGKTIFLCQEDIDGSSCSNKLGYKYSYSLSDGSEKNLREQNVEIISLELDPKFKIPEVIKIRDWTVVITPLNIKVGCTTVTLPTITKIIGEMGYKLVKK